MAVVQIQQMLDLRADKIVVMHLFAKFTSGTLDEEWIPQIAREKWVVITADRGRNKGPKLPSLCLEYSVTHVLMSSSISQMPSYGRILAIQNNIEKLVEAYYDEPGSRYSLTRSGTNDFATVLRKRSI